MKVVICIFSEARKQKRSQLTGIFYVVTDRKVVESHYSSATTAYNLPCPPSVFTRDRYIIDRVTFPQLDRVTFAIARLLQF